MPETILNFKILSVCERERTRVIQRDKMRDLDLPQMSSSYKTLVEMLTNLPLIPSLAKLHALYIPDAESLKLLRNVTAKKCFSVNTTLTIMGLK